MAPSGADASNLHECTDPAQCPNVFTGIGPGGMQGARHCFRYENGQLTTTPLWPWPMDTRIQQALARAKIAPGLSGTAGPGYAAGTVTSEIVARYGAIPPACLGNGTGPLPTGPPTLAIQLPAPKNLRLLVR